MTMKLKFQKQLKISSRFVIDIFQKPFLFFCSKIQVKIDNKKKKVKLRGKRKFIRISMNYK